MFPKCKFTTLSKVPQREMTLDMYQEYQEWSSSISTEFNASKKVVLPRFEPHFPCLTIPTHTLYQKDKKYAKIPYGLSTIGESGDAICCLEHALRTKWKMSFSLKDLAKECTEKGYYGEKHNTWHHLFDNCGATRVNDVYYIIRNIYSIKITPDQEGLTTVLVAYDKKEKPHGVLVDDHYVNIIGISKNNFFISDSNSICPYQRVNIPDFINKIKVAWIW